MASTCLTDAVRCSSFQNVCRGGSRRAMRARGSVRKHAAVPVARLGRALPPCPLPTLAEPFRSARAKPSVTLAPSLICSRPLSSQARAALLPLADQHPDAALRQAHRRPAPHNAPLVSRRQGPRLPRAAAGGRQVRSPRGGIPPPAARRDTARELHPRANRDHPSNPTTI